MKPAVMMLLVMVTTWGWTQEPVNPPVQERDSGEVWQTVGTLSWSLGAAGALTAGAAWFRGIQLRSEYNTASPDRDFDAYRSDLGLMNTLVNLGLGVMIAGGTGGLTALFLTPPRDKTPRTEDLDQQIRQLSIQGGQE